MNCWEPDDDDTRWRCWQRTARIWLALAAAGIALAVFRELTR